MNKVTGASDKKLINKVRYYFYGNNCNSSCLVKPDKILIFFLFLLMLFGLVMVTSSSIPDASTGKNPWIFSYAFRQASFMLLGIIVGAIVYFVPLQFWYNNSGKLLLLAIFLLVLILVPSITREINGAKRWIIIGGFRLQVSEFVRISVIIYASSFLKRYQNNIHKSWKAMIRLLFVTGLVSLLLLCEPDFGSAFVIFTVVFGMMFLAGVCLFRFIICTIFVGGIGLLIMISASYRMKRIAIFLNPWDDPYNKGYQITNSLIAIGRGRITGVGIGESLEKHHYLPEAHTDFIFSIIAEETGLIGVFVLMLIFAIIVWRSFIIANNADRARMRFASCLSYGIGLWVGMQALINISVASKIIPAKGLTLPMISYGGSSVLAGMILFAILLRVDSESRYRLNHEDTLKRGVSHV